MSYIDTMKLALAALNTTESDCGSRAWEREQEAITALREALAEQPAQGCNYCNHALYSGTKCKNCGREAAPVQEFVSMRMPKVGDRVVCIEDESLGTVVYLTAGGSPEIKFDDGSHGTYMLREFAELFGYTTPPAAQRQWVGLTDEEYAEAEKCVWAVVSMDDTELKANREFYCAIEAKLRSKNT